MRREKTKRKSCGATTRHYKLVTDDMFLLTSLSKRLPLPISELPKACAGADGLATSSLSAACTPSLSPT